MFRTETKMVELNTEIRKLRPGEMYLLAKILSPNSWKILLGVIPNLDSENDVPLFTSEHLRMIECGATKQHRPGAEIFLEEWSTMGRQRPTVKILIDLLVKVQLFRAADFLAVDVLKGEPPKRPDSGPAAPISIPNLTESHNELLYNLNSPDKADLQNIKYPVNIFSDYQNTNEDKLNDEDIQTFSNLIQFTSENIVNDELIEKSNSKLLIPNLEILHVDSLPVCIDSKYQDEFQSSKVTSCISESSLSSSSLLTSDTISTNSITHSQVNLDSSTMVKYPILTPLGNVLKSTELPLTVLEEISKL